MRGLSKSSLNVNEPTETISNENKFSDQQQTVDENGIRFLVDFVRDKMNSFESHIWQ